MPNRINYFDKVKLGRGLHCVWVQAPPGDPAPLVSIWIDPAMDTLEPDARWHRCEAAESSAPARCEGLAAVEQGTGDECEDEVPWRNSGQVLVPDSTSAAFSTHVYV
jgi:hypothetical protein